MVAAVAGVLGNQLTRDAVWAWVAFGVALAVGAGVTALVAYRTAPEPQPEPEPPVVEGPVAHGDVIMKGTYVAGHDITITGNEGRRSAKRP